MSMDIEVIDWFRFIKWVFFTYSQACLKYFKIMDYINTRQSKKIILFEFRKNFIFSYSYKHSQSQQIDVTFSIGCVQAH